MKPNKLFAFVIILAMLCLPACTTTVTKLNLENKLDTAKTEYLTSFFNIDQSDNPLAITAKVGLNSGSLTYALSNPGGNVVFGGVLDESDTLDEAISLPPIKGNYIFNLELKEFTGEYLFLFNQ